MRRIDVIAESGGTKTDWCLIESGEKRYLSTESYHPVNWGKAFIQRNRNFWKEHLSNADIRLVFFGAGCYRQEQAEKVKSGLLELGFSMVEVYSDLHAAGHALLDDNNGWCAILGTGSVVFEWKSKGIARLIGGKGHLEGDEGSGYYFGRLVIQDWIDRRLTDEQNDVLESLISNKPFLKSEHWSEQKFEVANVAKLLSDHQVLFRSFHQRNIELFLDKHFRDLSIDRISCVGGYVAHHERLIRELLKERFIDLTVVIQRPIVQLVEQKHWFID